MDITIPVAKDKYSQGPVPTEWRATFSAIVDAFNEGDFRLAKKIDGVLPIAEDDAVAIENNINGYGANLTDLPDDSWQSSAYQWMVDYWEVLVDLYTHEEGRSDLVLHARIYEKGAAYVFEVRSVHVP